MASAGLLHGAVGTAHAQVIPSDAASKSKLTNKISLTGQIVTKQRASERYITNPYTYCDGVKQGYKLEWLTLGEDHTSVRDAIITEQTNVGLLSALLLTVTFAYVFQVDDFDWDFIALQWGNSSDSTVNFAIRDNPEAASGEEIAKVHRDILQLLAIAATVFYILSTVHAVITIMMVSEMTGTIEPRAFEERVGFTNSYGLFAFLGGSVFMVCFFMYHFFIFCNFMATMLVGVFFMIIVVCVYVFCVVFRQMHAIFSIKATSVNNTPVTLSVKDLDQCVRDFVTDIGPENISTDVLTEFIRDRVATSTIEGTKDQASGVTFSTVTTQMIELLAAKVVDGYVAACVEQSAVLTDEQGKVLPSGELKSSIRASVASQAEAKAVADKI